MPGWKAKTLVTKHHLNTFLLGIPQTVILIVFNGMKASTLWNYLLLTLVPVVLNLFFLIDDYILGIVERMTRNSEGGASLGQRHLRVAKSLVEAGSFLLFAVALFGAVDFAWSNSADVLATQSDARRILLCTVLFAGWGMVNSLFATYAKLKTVTEMTTVGEMDSQIPPGYKFLARSIGRFLLIKIIQLGFEAAALISAFYYGQTESDWFDTLVTFLMLEVVLAIITYFYSVWTLVQAQFSIRHRLLHIGLILLFHFVLNLAAVIYACSFASYYEDFGEAGTMTFTWAVLYVDSALFFLQITHQLLYFAVKRKNLHSFMRFLRDVEIVQTEITRYSQFAFPGTSILFSVVAHALLANIPVIVVFGLYLSSQEQSYNLVFLQLADLIAGLVGMALFTVTFLCEIFTWKNLRYIFIADIIFICAVFIFRITNTFQLAEIMYDDAATLSNVFYILMCSNVLFWAMVAGVFLWSYDVLASSYIEGDLWGLPHLPNLPAYFLSIDAKRLAEAFQSPYRKINHLICFFVAFFPTLMILEGRGLIGQQDLHSGLAACFLLTLSMLSINFLGIAFARIRKPMQRMHLVLYWNTLVTLFVMMLILFIFASLTSSKPMEDLLNTMGSFFVFVIAWFLVVMKNKQHLSIHALNIQNAMVAWRRAEQDPFQIPTVQELIIEDDDGNTQQVVLNGADTPHGTLPEYASLRRMLAMGGVNETYVRRLNSNQEVVWTRLGDIPMTSLHSLSMRLSNRGSQRSRYQNLVGPHNSIESGSLRRFTSSGGRLSSIREGTLGDEQKEESKDIDNSESFVSAQEELFETARDLEAAEPRPGETITNQESDMISLSRRQPRGTRMGPWLRNINADGTISWLGAKELVKVRNLTEGLEGVTSRDLALLSTQEFSSKKAWIEAQMKKLRVNWEEGNKKLEFRRQRLLKEAQIIFSTRLEPSEFREFFRFSFIGEEGIDAGGVAREFWQLCAEKIFDPVNGLFEYAATDNITLKINKHSKSLMQDDWQDAYRFVGRFLAKAIFDFQIVPAYLTRPLYKHLLGVPILFSDLQFIDRSVHENLQWIDQNTGVDALFLDFTISEKVGDTIETIELKEGGADITVDDTNKAEYIDLYVRHIMLESTSDQLAAILQGFYDILPIGLFSILDFQELELLMCGLSEINVEDWKRHTVYTGYVNPMSNVVRWFWEVVAEFNDEQRARLLQFVTGTSRVPVGGFRALQGNDGERRNFTINGLESTNGYPIAHTCFNRIDMPNYTTKSRVHEILHGIIQIEVTGFSIE